MNLLNVPLVKQSRLACGPTALSMVLNWYGKNIPPKQITSAVGGLNKYGVRTVKLCEFAKKLGFQVDCLTFNKKLAKGKAKFKKPSVENILKHLRKKRPVILAVRSFILHNKKPSNMGHFIVITGHKGVQFYYNDPLDGKRHSINQQDLLFAWFNNVINSSAYLLAIWK